MYYIVKILGIVGLKKKHLEEQQYAGCIMMMLNYVDFASHDGSLSKSGGSDVQNVC